MNLVNQKRNEEMNRKLKREGAEKKRKRKRIQLGLVKLHADTMPILIKVILMVRINKNFDDKNRRKMRKA